jgi:hypothetical protein
MESLLLRTLGGFWNFTTGGYQPNKSHQPNQDWPRLQEITTDLPYYCIIQDPNTQMLQKYLTTCYMCNYRHMNNQLISECLSRASCNLRPYLSRRLRFLVRLLMVVCGTGISRMLNNFQLHFCVIQIIEH